MWANRKKSGYSKLMVSMLFVVMVFVFGRTAGYGEDSKAALLLRAENGDVYKGSDDKYYISNDLGIYVEAIDRNGDEPGVGVGQIEVKVDDGEFIKYYRNITDRIFFGGSGEHTMTYRVTDRLGNMTGDEKLTIVIDSDNPMVTLEYKVTDGNKKSFQKNNFIYLPKENSIKVNAEDRVSGIRRLLVSRDTREYEEMASGSEFSLQEDGVNIIKVKAQDNVMNESPLLIYTFYIDDIKPSIGIKTKYALVDELPVGGRGYNGRGGTSNATRDGEGKGANSFDATGSETGSEEVSNGNGVDDSLKDVKTEKGNRGKKAEGSDGVKRALPVEEVSIIGSAVLPGSSESDDGKVRMIRKYTNKNNVLNFVVTDGESGLSRVEWRMNGGEWKPYENDAISLEKTGQNTIEVRAYDEVGNYNMKSITVILDDLAPEMRLRVIKDKE